MEKGEHLIWTSEVNFEDWKKDLDSEYPELSEDEKIEKMFELNSDYLNDERINLNILLPSPIIVIGELHLWDGVRIGYKEIGNNIRNCLYSDTDDSTWYVDKYGDLRCDAAHHDGTNHYLYRMWKNTTSENMRENIKDDIYYGKVNKEEIAKYTTRIGDFIGSVYGWKFRGRNRDASKLK